MNQMVRGRNVPCAIRIKYESPSSIYNHWSNPSP